MTYRLLAASAMLASSLIAWSPTGQAQVVVPGHAVDAPGSGVFQGPLVSAARTYQLLIHESELTELVGAQIVGVSWRLPASATDAWPVAEVEYDAFDLHLGEGVAPEDRSLVFADNAVGTQTQVRSGPLVVEADAYTAGAEPNEFGPEVAVDSWQYEGGHLLVELRHQGHSGTSRTTDAFLASGTGDGYGSVFSAAWGNAYDAVEGSQANFSVMRLSFEGGDGGIKHVILNNLPADNDDDGSAIDALSRQAVRFTMPNETSAFVGALTLRLAGYEGDAVVELRDAGEDAGAPGDEVLLTFGEAAERGAVADEVEFQPDTSFLLEPETTYWLVVRGSSGQGFDWLASDPGITPLGLAEFDLFATSADGDTWELSDTFNSFRLAEGDDVIFADGFESDDDKPEG